ncbi:MAG: DUF3710 domain-containing protein [Actinomycetota bacterium]|nr:DUF3710 domain-containing protein [Actinomycetota bacterium]
MFRRRDRKQPDPEATDPGAMAGTPGASGTGGDRAVEPAPATGPWDADAIPADDTISIARLDLGGLRVPALPDMEVRLETDAGENVVAVVFVSGPSALQIGAFAAPRREGIWTDVRAELYESLRAEGDVTQRDGPFGPELLANVAGPQGRQNARFVGVDGPRWFLRGVFSGPAATDPVQAAGLEGALREVVVVRGTDPLPVRDPLPLALPREVLEQAGDAGADADRAAPGPPQRGPEITEIG